MWYNENLQVSRFACLDLIFKSLTSLYNSNRQKVRALGSATASAGLGTASGAADTSFDLKPLGKGPDEEKIKAILDRTGYKLDVTTGQRKYGGPPPNWTDPPPPNGCEVNKP